MQLLVLFRLYNAMFIFQFCIYSIADLGFKNFITINCRIISNSLRNNFCYTILIRSSNFFSSSVPEISKYLYSYNEIIRLLIKQFYPPHTELIISYILGSEPSFRVMAVAVAVLEGKDITFILCVSTSQDTVSCKVSVFIHWIYCFQQKIPLPDATAS